MLGFLLLAAITLGVMCGIYFLARSRGATGWLSSYIRWSLKSRVPKPQTHVIFCLVDHYEPRWGGKRDMPKERARVNRWVDEFPAIAAKYTDADGIHPKHSFFFPEEEYEAEHIDALSSICRQGFGEIEIHLHHDNDTSENLRQTLTNFAELLHARHGALPLNPLTQKPSYAFIHGNWVLDNSDPSGHWCGVNDEITILRDTGCYADYTFPCAPHIAQPKQVNSIYYAIDDPSAPKSHDTGPELKNDNSTEGDLVLITGPLRLNWGRRKFGLIPRIENSDLRSSNPPTKERVDLWVDSGIHVAGHPEWVFVKVHTHGAPESEASTLLGPKIHEMHEHLTTKYNDGENYCLHYTSAREMYNIVKAAESGCRGNPNQYRDYVLPPPPNTPAGEIAANSKTNT